MFARVTTYKMNPDRIAEAESKLEGLMPQVMALAGLKSFTNAIDAEGNGIVVSVVESEETSEANKEKVAEIWAAFGAFLIEPPSAIGYRVIAHETV